MVVSQSFCILFDELLHDAEEDDQSRGTDHMRVASHHIIQVWHYFAVNSRVKENCLNGLSRL